MALFEPYRCIGLVCDEVAPAVNQLGKETFLTVSIGKAFQVFKADKLGLSIVSQQIDRKIMCASFSYSRYLFIQIADALCVGSI